MLSISENTEDIWLISGLTNKNNYLLCLLGSQICQLGEIADGTEEALEILMLSARCETAVTEE
jgi:hypothetical protein